MNAFCFVVYTLKENMRENYVLSTSYRTYICLGDGSVHCNSVSCDRVRSDRAIGYLDSFNKVGL